MSSAGDGHGGSRPGQAPKKRRISQKVVYRSNRASADDPAHPTRISRTDTPAQPDHSPGSPHAASEQAALEGSVAEHLQSASPLNPQSSIVPITPPDSGSRLISAVDEPTLSDAIGLTRESRLREEARRFEKTAFGTFEGLQLIGSGTMGLVFRALATRGPAEGEEVAIKMLLPAQGQLERQMRQAQFAREADAQTRVSHHPNVVRLYESGQTEQICWIAMELVLGGDLYQHVNQHGPLDLEQARVWFRQAADAVHTLHTHGVHHRDIKPPNLMLHEGQVKLADFGLVRIVDPPDSFQWITQSVGSPLYAAPEISRTRSADALSDIYSLGATFYFGLTGRHPYSGDNNKQIRIRHKTEPVPDPRRANPHTPDTLADVVMRCMAKDPANRFTSAEGLLDALWKI